MKGSAICVGNWLKEGGIWGWFGDCHYSLMQLFIGLQNSCLTRMLLMTFSFRLQVFNFQIFVMLNAIVILWLTLKQKKLNIEWGCRSGWKTYLRILSPSVLFDVHWVIWIKSQAVSSLVSQKKRKKKSFILKVDIHRNLTVYGALKF